METKYTIYRVDGTQEDGSVDWPEDPPLSLLRKFIEAIVEGPLEHVSVIRPDAKTADSVLELQYSDIRDMFVDEIGHVRREPKPRNETATKIYRAATFRHNPICNPESLAWIAGTAILFHRKVWS